MGKSKTGATSGFASEADGTLGRSRDLSGSGSGAETAETYRNVLKDIRKVNTVSFRKDSDHELAKKSLGLSGISDNEFASMFGFLDGSELNVEMLLDRSFLPSSIRRGVKSAWKITTIHPAYSTPQISFIYKTKTGKLGIFNDTFGIKPEFQNQRLGTISLAKQAYFARKNGVSSIIAKSVRGYDSNSYYSLARQGFDRKLTAQEIRDASKLFGSVTTVRDVINKPGGPEFWLNYGNRSKPRQNFAKSSVRKDMNFDLNKISKSSRDLRSYVKNTVTMKDIKMYRDLVNDEFFRVKWNIKPV